MDMEEVGGKKSESEIGEERNGRFVQNCLQMEAGLGCFLPRGKHKVQSWLWLFGWLALPRIIILSKVESVKISTLVENPDLQKGWGGCGEGHPRGGDQAGKDLCRLHGGQPGQHPKIGHVTKCDDQELATMINKGKGKLKWERDMPRDIEEKLEVMMMIVVMTMTMMMMVTMELIMVEIIMLRHNHFAVI